MVRLAVSALMLAIAGLLLGPLPVPPASSHLVTCTNSAQSPFFNNTPSPTRATLQGATWIECTPSAPDSQRTRVQVQLELTAGNWTNRGNPYITYSNARIHREYDSTSCRLHRWDYWRTYATHTGTHHNTGTKVSISYEDYVYCKWNNS